LLTRTNSLPINLSLTAELERVLRHPEAITLNVILQCLYYTPSSASFDHVVRNRLSARFDSFFHFADTVAPYLDTSFQRIGSTSRWLYSLRNLTGFTHPNNEIPLEKIGERNYTSPSSISTTKFDESRDYSHALIRTLMMSKSPYMVAVENIWAAGARTVRLAAPFQMKNDSSIPWVYQFFTSGGEVWSSIVLPKAIVQVPLTFSLFESVRMRPALCTQLPTSLSPVHSNILRSLSSQKISRNSSVKTVSTQNATNANFDNDSLFAFASQPTPIRSVTSGIGEDISPVSSLPPEDPLSSISPISPISTAVMEDIDPFLLSMPLPFNSETSAIQYTCAWSVPIPRANFPITPSNPGTVSNPPSNMGRNTSTQPASNVPRVFEVTCLSTASALREEKFIAVTDK